jgi:hypothetical protein
VIQLLTCNNTGNASAAEGLQNTIQRLKLLWNVASLTGNFIIRKSMISEDRTYHAGCRLLQTARLIRI